MSLATTDHCLPTVFEAKLPQLDYENAPEPLEAHRRLAEALRGVRS